MDEEQKLREIEKRIGALELAYKMYNDLNKRHEFIRSILTKSF